MDYKKKRLQKGKVIKLFVNSVFLFFDSSQPMRTQETLGSSGALKSDSGKNSNSKKKRGRGNLETEHRKLLSDFSFNQYL